MRYHYALAESGKLVNIQELEAGPGQYTYVCPGCGEPLIPKLGSIKQWHFAHKPGSLCSSETYLHRLGKHIFYETYSHCLRTGSPFAIGFYQQICRQPYARLPGLTAFRCDAMALQRYDLCRWFPDIVLEQAESGFVPDLLLRDKSGNPGIYVEIRVSHGCSPAKLASGRRILEIRLQSEADLALIGRGLREQRCFELRETDVVYAPEAPVRYYNFSRRAQAPAQACDCYRQQAFVFRICRFSGRPLQSLMSLPEAAAYHQRAGSRFSFFACGPSEGHAAFSRRARQHYAASLRAATQAGVHIHEQAI